MANNFVLATPVYVFLLLLSQVPPKAASVDAPVASLFQIERHGRRATDQRWFGQMNRVTLPTFAVAGVFAASVCGSCFASRHVTDDGVSVICVLQSYAGGLSGFSEVNFLR